MNGSMQWRLALAAILIGGTLTACTGLTPPAVDEISIYVFDARPAMTRLPLRPGAILAVDTPRAWPGFDTARMAYVKRPYELEYFTKSRWAHPPARMLGPLLARSLEQSGAFDAVVQFPSAVAGTLRLDIELVHLQQEFETQPSRVRVTLRARLVDMEARRVMRAGEFEEVEVSAADNAYAGVAAINRALERMLPRLAEFCASIE